MDGLHGVISHEDLTSCVKCNSTGALMAISMTMNLSTEAYNMFLSTLRLTAFTDANYNVHMVSKCMDASITIHLLVLTFDTLVMKNLHVSHQVTMAL